MKRYGIVALIALLVLGLAVYFAACSGGGGGGGTQHVNYSTAAQAAAGAASVSGAISLTSVVDEAANLASGVVPPPGSYAPSLGAKATDTSAIANIDPRLKDAVDKMVADLKSPTVQNAIAKARSFKTASSLASAISASVSCGRSGYFTITGADTSTATFNERTIDVAYYNCINSASLTDYQVASGGLHFYGKEMLDNTGSTNNLTATTLTLATYTSSTLSGTDAINGTFNSVYSLGTNSVATYSNSVNASFSVALADSTKFSLSMNNLNGAKVHTPGTGTTSYTEEMTINGGIVFDISDSTGSLLAITLAYTGLNDKYQEYTDYSSDEWLNGTVSLTWTPDMGGNCLPGSITLTTITPIHVGPNGGCPTFGTLTANNATIQFGNPAPYGVTVSVGGTSAVFTDCNFSGADSCGFDGGTSPQPM